MAEEKKQVPLRLSPKLYAAIAAWAEDDFRSVKTGFVTKRARDYDLSPFFLTSFCKTDTMYGGVKAPLSWKKKRKGFE